MFAAKNELLTPSSTGYRISRSLRFRSSASAFLSRTPSVAGNSNAFTFSFWAKRGALGITGYLFDAFQDANNRFYITFLSDNTMQISQIVSASATLNFQTTAVFRDCSSWYHFIVSINSAASGTQKCRLWINGVENTVWTTSVNASFTTSTWNTINQHRISQYGGGGANSFDGYIAEVNFIDGQALTPSSFGANDASTGVWGPKQYTGTYGTNGFYLPFTNTNSTSQNLITYSEQFDNAAWAKPAAPVAPVVTANTTTAPNGTTTADTVTFSGSTTHPCFQEVTVSVANGATITTSMYIKASSGSSFLLQCAILAPSAQDGYSIITFTGGVATVSPSSGFMSSTVTDVGNGWYRITATATNQTGVTATSCRISIGQGGGASSIFVWGAQMNYGSAYPPYIATVASAQTTATTNLGADYQIAAGGGWNNWLSNNISVAANTTYDSMIDSPTNYADGGNGRGNYCVLNPISNIGNGTISNGNLSYTSGAAAWKCASGTIFVSSGKWYFEATLTSSSSSAMYGVINNNFPYSGYATYPGASPYGWALQSTTGGTGKWNNNSSTSVDAVSQAANDVYMVAFDVDAGKIWFGKNGTWYGSGDPANGTNAAYTNLTGQISPVISTVSASDIAALNCGQRPFAYTPPSGFLALNTQNLPTPTIANGAQNFDATIYIGNNANNRSITNSALMRPDLVWVKDRSDVNFNILFDSVRGGFSLYSNITGAEDNMSSSYGWSNAAPSNTGFVVDKGTNNALNNNSNSYVGWQWKAGGAPTVNNTAGAGNVPTAGSVLINGANSTSALAGSIAATRISANQSAGFSVVTYTGTGANATVGHGLGVAPSMIMIKDRDSSTNGGAVYHTSIGATKFLKLFQTTTGTDGEATDNTVWNGGSPTFSSTVFSVGTSVRTNSVDKYVAYCFASVAGYSAFGSYTGNGSADGPFVYTGFRPRWVIIKRSDSTSNWFIHDTSRDPFNVSQSNLYAELSSAEDTLAAGNMDFLSNGFKSRTGSGSNPNVSGGTYIYAAFCELPFKTSRAR
jgi:hypothetical protein